MHGWTWGERTSPFSPVDAPDAPVRIVIEQIDDRHFRPHVDHGFTCTFDDGRDPITVTAETLESSDLASIPGYLSWFASRHGRHTPAALVHDQLVAPGITYEERSAADDVFLELMDRLDVPPVRRHVMWAAVTAATRWTGGWRRRLGVAVWFVAALCGMALFVAGLVTMTWWWVAVALLAPIPAAALWGERWRAGLIAGYALPPIAGPATAAWAGYAAYWLVEEGVRRVLALRPARTVEDLPAPTPYSEM